VSDDVRGKILAYLERQLVGPIDGSREELRDLPDKRYTLGILFPRHARQLDALRDDIDDSSGGSLRDEMLDDPVVLANQWLPSSIGVSFYTVGARAVRCVVRAAAYDRPKATERCWVRVPLSESDDPETHTIMCPAESGRVPSSFVLDGRATLEANFRDLGEGRLVTVSLVNAMTLSDDERPKPEHSLYQVSLECSVVDGDIREYPRLEYLTADPEEEELFVLYRRQRAFALGHGCAAGWTLDPSGTDQATSVRTELIPHVEVPGVVPTRSASDRFLRLSVLADGGVDLGDVERGLTDFVDEYGSWIDALHEANADIPATLVEASDRLVTRMRASEAGIRSGISLLVSDPLALRAFRLANLAMLMQMRHSRLGAGAETGSIEGHLAFDQDAWYPFQLAFFLIVLPSLLDREAPDRAVVDLIWFPTGGGKTEAYLLITAFEILLRRIRDGERGAGTAVLTRGTRSGC
jgi:hypothetical protein